MKCYIRNLVAVDIDFSAEQSIYQIIEKNKGKKYKDTKLYCLPIENYDKLLADLEEDQLNPITLHPLPPISENFLRLINSKKLEFKCRDETHKDDESDDDEADTGNKIILDYSNDDVKEFETLPKKVKDKLFGFQREGVKYALKKHARLLIADEMG